MLKLPKPKSGEQLFSAWRRLSLKVQLMLIHGVLMLLLTVFSSLLITVQMDNSSRYQADTLGSLLSKQTANAAASMLITGDRLSLNVLLNQLAQNPYIAEAAIYSIDNRRIARADSENAAADALVYSAPINYQDVIAGYVRLTLDGRALNRKTREILQLTLAAGALLLLTGLLLLNFYGASLADKLRRIERQLQSIFKTLPVDPLPNTEIDRIALQVEHQLTEKMQAEKAVQDQQPQEEITAIISIRIKNLGRLQALLASQDMLELIRQQTAMMTEAAELYDGQLSYTPEGNSYIRFSSRKSPRFALDALCCSLLIQTLTHRITEQSIARIQLGLGLCFSDQISELPKEQHPSLADNAASQALVLANLSQPDGLHMLRRQLGWLPADIMEIQLSDHGDDIVHIQALSGDDHDIIEEQARTLQPLQTQAGRR